MISPSPTQQQPEHEVKPEEKKIRSTPAKRKAGQTPAARFVKAILRPVLKGIYYLLRGMRDYKIITLIISLLLLGSIAAASYWITGELPFGIGADPFNFHVHGRSVGGDHVKNWLFALRDGDTTTMSLIQSELIMTTPPDPNQLASQFSQPKGNLTWKAVNVIGVYSESDTTVDSFVEVDLATNGPGGSNSGILIWHFTTLQQDGRILYIDLVSFRKPLPSQ
ncbi:MAG TPA: hypothetical protein VKP04_02930 [Ktedonobacteraceae bacterium]|nr:hypothetical protein [Ktedonobacteraceae bacterium]